MRSEAGKLGGQRDESEGGYARMSARLLSMAETVFTECVTAELLQIKGVTCFQANVCEVGCTIPALLALETSCLLSSVPGTISAQCARQTASKYLSPEQLHSRKTVASGLASGTRTCRHPGSRAGAEQN